MPVNDNHFFYEGEYTSNYVQSNPHRPSSIKSYKQSTQKSPSSFNNYSASSLKQCAADMVPLERNSKAEVSFPSFLNVSGENAHHIHLARPSTSNGDSPIIVKNNSAAKLHQESNSKYGFSIKFKSCSETPKSEAKSS